MRYWTGVTLTGLVALYGFVDYGLDWDSLVANSGLTRGFIFAAFMVYLVWYATVLSKFHNLTPKKRLYNNLVSPDVPWEQHETAQELEHFERIPGAVVVDGLLMYVDGEPVEIPHAVICGNRAALVFDHHVAEGVYRLNGGNGNVMVDGQFLFASKNVTVALERLRKQMGRHYSFEAWTFLRGDDVRVDPAEREQAGHHLGTPWQGIEEMGRWFLDGNHAHTVRRPLVEKMWVYVNNYIAVAKNL